jgi:single-strand DNA-binding protein
MNGIECAFVATVGTEAELKTSQAGKPWTNFNACVGSGDDAQWLRVAVFGARAEELSGQLHKGDKVYCEGRLELRSWEKDGQKQAGLNVAAWKVERLGQIGRNKPVKSRPAPEGDHPIAPSKGGFDKQLDDEIPFMMEWR